MNSKSLTFTEFLVEYSAFDGITTDISEEHEGSEEHYQRYKQAREYIIDMLGKLQSNFKSYNSEQAQIMIDRTARKFNLTDSQVKALEIDVFDWENRDNEEMHENAQLSLPNMKKNFQHIKTSGFRNKKVKAYNEWNNSDQKPGSIIRKTKY